MNMQFPFEKLLALAVFLFLCLGLGTSFAEEPSEPLRPVLEQQVTPSPTTPTLASQEASVPGGVLLMTAYMILWLLFFGYLIFLMRRQKALTRDLENLERRMDEVLGLREPS
ncbi:MAG: CcmD family protein [Bradymonadaceae bacterium]